MSQNLFPHFLLEEFNLSLSQCLSLPVNLINDSTKSEYRWTITKQSRFVESLILNLPVSPIFLQEVSYKKYILIDGIERLNAVSNFVKNKLVLDNLEYLSHLNRKRLNQLNPFEIDYIKNRKKMRFYAVVKPDDKSTELDAIDLKHRYE